ncbi:MAG: hypothetical protein NZ872_02300 [Archaeoglobaceae archaeon]|nr:hypothetical protein [Archaeoglobaceae archaeon]MDW8128030.1 hypothetical protein [Archaeoglobaceae archaeon]
MLFTSIPQIFLLILFFSLIAFDIAKLRSFKAFIYYSLAIVLFAIFWQLAEIFEEYGILFEAIAVVSFAFFAFYYPFLKVRRAV